MRTRMKFFATLVALLVIWATPLHAQQVVQPAPRVPGAWQLIGRTQANHSVDHDTIFVRGPFDNFRRIKSNIVPARWNEGITVKRFEAIS